MNRLRLLLLAPFEADERVNPISDYLRDMGIETMRLDVAPRSDAASMSELTAMLEESDAILIFLIRRSMTQGTLQSEMEQVVQRAGGKTALVVLDKMPTPEIALSVRTYNFFETAERDYDVALQQLGEFVMDMAGSTLTASPEESTATETTTSGDEPPEAPQTAESETPTPETADDEDQTEADTVSDDSEARTDKPGSLGLVNTGIGVLVVGLIVLGLNLNREIPEIFDGVLYVDQAEFAGDLLLIRPESYLMGTNDNDAPIDERPAHNVNLDRPFFVLEREVTVEAYATFVGYTGRR